MLNLIILFIIITLSLCNISLLIFKDGMKVYPNQHIYLKVGKKEDPGYVYKFEFRITYESSYYSESPYTFKIGQSQKIYFDELDDEWNYLNEVKANYSKNYQTKYNYKWKEKLKENSTYILIIPLKPFYETDGPIEIYLENGRTAVIIIGLIVLGLIFGITGYISYKKGNCRSSGEYRRRKNTTTNDTLLI